MKIPKSFQLAGLKWTVEETNNISEMGHCNYNECVIRLKKDLNPQMKAATFCHELQHAMKFMTGRFDHDEVEIDAMGNMLFQFLQQYGR